MVVHKLTADEVPDGSLIAVLSDIHIPHHDARALHAVIECCENEGVTHVVLNGDIADCGVGSRHPSKKARDTIVMGDLPRSIESGRWIYDWARTRNAILTRGNHEAWLESRIAEDPVMQAVTPEALLGLPESGVGWLVLPSKSRLRLGSLVIEHGDGLFPTGSGGENPGARIKRVAPDQTTLIGHLHRDFFTCWTTRDENDVPRTHAAMGTGHISDEGKHVEYAGSYPCWQQSFALIRTWTDFYKMRFTIIKPLIHRDTRNKPVFEYNGRVYRG